jgi:hypothetical protein
MKNSLRIIIFIVIFVLHFPELSAQTEKNIIRINKIVENISHDTTLDVISFPDYELYIFRLVYGGKIKGYFKKNLIRITEEMFYEDAVVLSEFYYLKGKLIYFRERRDSYLMIDRYIEPKKWPKKKEYEWLFYFNHGKLIYRNTLPASTHWDIDFKAERKIIYTSRYLFDFLTSKYKGS